MRVHHVLVAVIAVTIIGAGLAWYGYDYLRSRADWEDVQKAAFRVDSGLRHETLILLRSKVADLDAALSHYVTGWGHRSRENRVTSIRQAIESLEWAIDHEKKTAIEDGDEEFPFFQDRPYLIAEPNCLESTGKLFLTGPELARASLTYAQAALVTPDQTPTVRTVDISSVRAKCASEYAA